jgi:hypothetical protein
MAPDYKRVMPHAQARPIKLTGNAQTIDVGLCGPDVAWGEACNRAMPAVL